MNIRAPQRSARWSAVCFLTKGEHELGFADEFAVDGGGAFAFADGAAGAEDFDFQANLVAWFHLPLKAAVVDAGEKSEAAAVFFALQEDDGADLGERLDDQHAGHDRVFGEVAGEKRFVGADVFDADGALSFFDFQNAVNKQKRIAVRDDRLDLLDVKHRNTPFS